ncbi:MAG: hypothetical protein EA427_14270, partial [Spirochaetaceae bacterium]
QGDSRLCLFRNTQGCEYFETVADRSRGWYFVRMASNIRFVSRIVPALLLALFLPGIAGAEEPTPATSDIGVRLVAEAGFLGVIDHRIRYSGDDPVFRYDRDGGQDVLFPFYRLSAELEIGPRHTGPRYTGPRHAVIFLYQPLTLRTRVEMPQDFVLDGETFTGDSLDLLYNFPFYRLSYLREVFRTPAWSVAAGGSMQIRNATIEFEGNQGGFYRSAGIGPVPLLKVRARYTLPSGLWLESEIDGVYAPISFLNGSDNDTVGALLDGSVRAGYPVSSRVEPFLNLRYLGGGASNKDPSDYTVNWLNVVTLSLGVAARL